MGNPVPTQSRSVDPYASYNSNIVNALTRIVSNGNDCILNGSKITATIDSTSSISLSSGRCIKDDVLIEIDSIVVDMTDEDFYVSPSTGFWGDDGYYYIVLEYTYTKSKPAPIAYIKVVQPSERTNDFVFNTSHLLLAVIQVSSGQIIDILDEDPEYPNNSVNFQGADPDGGGGGEPPVDDSIVSAKPSGNYSITTDDDMIYGLGGNTMTLPWATSETKHTIIKYDSTTDPVIVATQSGNTIEGKTTISLVAQYDSVTVVSDGINLWVEI